ncbi:MAG: hypothetical protein JWM57_4411, partial [Phycisphaerales bacterium]|nr:hypothetical protein [Phycisphaerales bacterium]
IDGGTTAYGDVIAFPGVDGAGAAVTGGRGGVVYHVTKLDTKLGDNGPGTLQYGANDSNFTVGGVVTPRTIVFDVGGTVWLGRLIGDKNGWDTTNVLNIGSNVTLAGQTAPGGITIMGGQIKVNGNRTANPTTPVANTIIRNITMAAGYGTRQTNSASGYHDGYAYDNMDINSSGVVVDHSTALYATDESISSNETANKVTVQYTTIAQGQSYPQADAEASGTVYKSHALASLWAPGSNSTSTFSHNLFAQMSGRIPTIQTESGKLTGNVPGYTDFRNNVVYNWFGTAGYGSSGSPGAGNFIGNYYKVGVGGDSASSNASTAISTVAGGTTVFTNSASTTIYQAGNVRQNLNGTTTALVSSNFGNTAYVQANAYAQLAYNGVTDAAANAYSQVTNYSGANWQNRSLIDARLVAQVLAGTGKITALDDANNGYNSAGQYITSSTDNPDLEWNRLLAMRSVTNGGIGGTGTYVRAANYDTDQDGMPDIWEAAMGFNPTAADNNGVALNDGYTNLEAYLNEVAAWPASTALVFNNGNATGRFAELGNWQNGVYKPTRYDVAQVNSGTATIDVVGQHAGTLSIATTVGSNATAAITGGWIDVAGNVLVGVGGTGALNQSGGLLRAGSAVIIGGTTNAGTYTMSGGVLATPLLIKGTAGGAFNFTGGTLHADTIGFSFVNQGGTIAPGSELALQLMASASMPDINNNVEAISAIVGSTHVVGNLTLQSGTLQIDLASLGSFDTLVVDGTLILGGALDVRLVNGYLPQVGDRWQIGSAGLATGAFASVPLNFAIETSGGNVFLTAVPEPSALGLLAIVGGIGGRRRRDQRR